MKWYILIIYLFIYLFLFWFWGFRIWDLPPPHKYATECMFSRHYTFVYIDTQYMYIYSVYQHTSYRRNFFSFPKETTKKMEKWILIVLLYIIWIHKYFKNVICTSYLYNYIFLTCIYYYLYLYKICFF